MKAVLIGQGDKLPKPGMKESNLGIFEFSKIDHTFQQHRCFSKYLFDKSTEWLFSSQKKKIENFS